MAAVPSTKTNLTLNDGGAWFNLFGITSGIADLDVAVFGGNGNYYCIGFYSGSSGITLSNYNALPVGTVIHDKQAYKTHYHDAATTWKSSAAAS